MNQFELFLNRMRGGDMPSVDMPMPQQPQQPDFRLPSHIATGADGAGRVTADFATGAYNNPMLNQSIPGMNMGNELGVAQGQVQGQGNFNIMNPFTYGNMNKAVEGTRAGDENIQYSDSPAGQVGEAANERNRLLKQLLEGS